MKWGVNVKVQACRAFHIEQGKRQNAIKQYNGAVLTHNDTHCGHVPCRPPLVTTKGVGVLLGEESTMRFLFRIKWVWICGNVLTA